MDSNHNKQIQNVLRDGVGWLKVLFFGAFVSVCFHEKGRISTPVGVTWVSVFLWVVFFQDRPCGAGACGVRRPSGRRSDMRGVIDRGMLRRVPRAGYILYGWTCGILGKVRRQRFRIHSTGGTVSM